MSINSSSSDVNIIDSSSAIDSTDPRKYFEGASVGPDTTNDLVVWEWKTIGYIGSNVDIRSNMCRTRSKSSLMERLLETNYPLTYAKAKGKIVWEKAITTKYESSIKNQTWDLVPLPL